MEDWQRCKEGDNNKKRRLTSFDGVMFSILATFHGDSNQEV